jgi:hypothetical protein
VVSFFHWILPLYLFWRLFQPFMSFTLFPKNIHNKVNDMKDWNSCQKGYNGSILWKKQQNDVSKSTEDKMYSAMVSLITKVLPDDGHMWLKHVATRNECIS